MKRPVLAWCTLLSALACSGEAEDQKTLQAVDPLIKSRDYGTAIALLKTRLEDSSDLSLRLKLAETYVLAKQEDDALGELDRMQVEFARKEREIGTLSEEEYELLKGSNKLINQVVRGGMQRDRSDGKPKTGPRVASESSRKSTELALRLTDKQEPREGEALKQEKLSRDTASEPWKDLTHFELLYKLHHEDAFGINSVPDYAQTSFLKLKEAGFKKCIFLHPRDVGIGVATFYFPFPVTEFKASVAITSNRGGNAEFKVRLGQTEVYHSGPVKSGDAPKRVIASFPPSQTITLLTDCLGSNGGDHCIWLDPLVR